jgi:hypothetical protein
MITMTKTDKPRITKREASRRVAEAGAAALAKASRSHGDPKHLAALMESEVPVDLAGYKIGPVPLSSFLAIDQLWNTPGRNAGNAISMRFQLIFAFIEPAKAFALLQEGYQPFSTAVNAFITQMSSITDEQFLAMEKLVTDRINTFYGLQTDDEDSRLGKFQGTSTTGRKP